MANDWMSFISGIILLLLICRVRSTVWSPLYKEGRLNQEVHVDEDDSRSTSSKEIPLDLWVEMTKVKSPQEFAERFIDPNSHSFPPSKVFPLGPDGRSVDLDQGELNSQLYFRPHRPDPRILAGSGLFKQSRMGGPSPMAVGKMTQGVALSANCEPRLSPVNIPRSQDPTVFQWPICTLVERCGGCCGNPVLHCIPQKSEKVTVKVMRMNYNPEKGSLFDFKGSFDIQLEKHTSCVCVCRYNPDECSAAQEYKNCQCHCRNKFDAATCNGSKIWNENECRCVCRDVTPCEKGFYFNETFCSCERYRPPTYRPRKAFRKTQSTTPMNPFIDARPVLTKPRNVSLITT